MQWETPEIVEISLACEISSYANAELSAPATQPRNANASQER